MDKQQIKQILSKVPEGHDPKITITCREKLALIEENEKLKVAILQAEQTRYQLHERGCYAYCNFCNEDLNEY